MTTKGYIIEDTGTKVVVLESQGLYKSKVTGEVFKVEYGESVELPVQNWEDLVFLKQKSYIKEYVNSDTEDRISAGDYEDIKSEFLKRSTEDEYGDLTWNTLEDEFNYRKFTSIHTPIYNTEYGEVDVVVENFKSVKVDTGNEFIYPLFCKGYNHSSMDIYIYNRELAVKNILHKKMDELGVEYAGENTNIADDEKKWTNSNHSGIRFAKLGNSYIFNSSYGKITQHRGTLEKMKTLYEEDVKEIRYLVDYQYKKMYGSVNNEKSFIVKECMEGLRKAKNILTDVTPFRKSERDFYRALKELEEVEKKLVEILE